MNRWWLVTLVLALHTAAACADDLPPDPLARPNDPIARDYLLQGNRLYRQHELARAIDAYAAGSVRDDTPVFLYNLAQCHRQLGNYAEAIWHYERFVARTNPIGALRDSIDRFVRDMKAQLGRRISGARVEPWYADAAGWSLAASGAIATFTGGYLLIESSELAGQANREARESVRIDLRDGAETRRGVAAITGIAGVGLLVAGIVKLAMRDTTWTIAPTGRGVTALVRF
jgi:tetratricopeptide (TPR) repeat protein